MAAVFLQEAVLVRCAAALAQRFCEGFRGIAAA